MGATSINMTLKSKDRETFRKKYNSICNKQRERNGEDAYAGNWGCVDSTKIKTFNLTSTYSKKAKIEIDKMLDSFIENADKGDALAVEVLDKNGKVKEYVCVALVRC